MDRASPRLLLGCPSWFLLRRQKRLDRTAFTNRVHDQLAAVERLVAEL
jgi:hypothetical protein